MRPFIFQIVLISLMLLSARAYAAEKDGDCEGDCVAIGEWQFAVALGVGGRTNPVLEQNDLKYFILPEVRYYGERFFIENYELGFTLVDRPRHQLHVLFISPSYDHIFFNDWDLTSFSIDNLTLDSPLSDELSNPVGGGAEPGDSDPLFDDDSEIEFTLKKRRISGLGGFEYTYSHERFEFQFQALRDVTNVHHGSKIRAALTVPFQMQKNTLLATVGLTEQSADLLNYYYGLQASEVSNDAFVYKADRGLSSYFRLDFRRPINEKWTFRGIASYKKLGSTITNSPIVVDDGVFTVFVGGVYHF